MPGKEGMAMFTTQSRTVAIAAMLASIPNMGKKTDAPAALTPNSVNENEGIMELARKVRAMAKNIDSNLTSREKT